MKNTIGYLILSAILLFFTCHIFPRLTETKQGMENLRGIERGRVWRRPVKIKELETKNKVIGTLREIDLVI